MSTLCRAVIAMGLAVFTVPALAQSPFFFSTGTADNRIGTASRPDAGGKIEIESADDFITGAPLTFINHATFTGLITGSTPTIGMVNVEIYRVFPFDSVNPPNGQVPSRINSPSDNVFDARDTGAGTLTFTTSTLATNFTASNSVLNGIHPLPNPTTGGEGPVTGNEVQFSVDFATPFSLPASHYFFVPQVQITGGEFYWLSGQRPALTPFNPDLQSWIRDANLDPNWLRIGTDIVGGTPAPTFNAAFSVSGQAVPEPGPVALAVGAVFGSAGLLLRRRRRR